jgi:hypothetical protein
MLGAGRRRAADDIATLEEAGWELEWVAAPHYGALTLIGHFRRATSAPDERDEAARGTARRPGG